MDKPVRKVKPQKRRKKLGEYLMKAGLIDKKTLIKALEIQKEQKKKLGQTLIDMGVADDEEIAKALARQLQIPLIRLNKAKIPNETISLVSQEVQATPNSVNPA